MRKLFNIRDFAVIAAALVLCLALALPQLSGKKNELTALIYVDGKIKYTVRLDEVEKSYILSPREGTEITVDKGKIAFTHAKCRDALCINSGWLDSAGQTAACLPEKIVIVLQSDKNPLDAVTY